MCTARVVINKMIHIFEALLNHQFFLPCFLSLKVLALFWGAGFTPFSSEIFLYRTFHPPVKASGPNIVTFMFLQPFLYTLCWHLLALIIINQLYASLFSLKCSLPYLSL